MTTQTSVTALQIFLVSLLIVSGSHVCLCVCLYVCLSHWQLLSSFVPHLFLQYAVEDEDKHALQRVEDGEKVGHDHGALVDVH